MCPLWGYWESIKNENEHLYERAKIIFSIPSTEVEIDRDFLKLNFIYSERRHWISEQLFKAIFIIHFSKKVFYKDEELTKSITSITPGEFLTNCAQ